MVDTLLATVAQAGSLPSLALLQSGDYGPWGTIIGILQGLVVGAGGLGIVVGLGVKASAMGNSERQEFGNRMLERAVVGVLLGLPSVPLYNLIVQWTS